MIRTLWESGMRILALALADLRTLSRARGLGIERSLFTGALLIAVAVSWPDRAADSVIQMSRFGASVFAVFFYTAYIATAFLVPTLFSGAFAAERRGHQAQILFSTPLHPAELVLARFASHFGRIVLVVACGVPILFSALLFGGVAGAQVLMAVVSILTLTFFIGALTLFISVISGKGYVAGSAAILFLLAEMFVASLALVILEEVIGWRGAENILPVLMPHFALVFLPLPDLGMPTSMWVPVAEALGLGVVFLALSVVFLRPLSLRLHTGDAKKKTAKRPRGAAVAARAAPVFWARYRGPVWKNPLAWKEVRVRSSKGRWLRAALLGLLVVIGMGVLLMVSSEGMDWAQANSILISFEIIGVTLAAVNMASTAVSGEREDGSLDLLAVTPLTAGKILLAKWAGVIRNLAFLLVIVSIHFLVWCLTSLGPDGEPMIRGLSVWGGFHPMGDLVRFVPLLASALTFAFTLAAGVAGGLLISCMVRKNSTAVTAANGSLLLWWIGLPMLILGLGGNRLFEKTLAFNPVLIASSWAMTQSRFGMHDDIHSPTLLFFFAAGILFAVFTALFPPAIDRLLGRKAPKPVQRATCRGRR